MNVSGGALRRLVLGLGNPLQGDDGLGPRAVELLRQRQLPAEVSVEDGGTPGWGLASTLQDWGGVILVDAAELGLRAGEWRSFSLVGAGLHQSPAALSLHAAGTVEGLALAKSLGILPEDLTLYCMQPGCVQAGMSLSPAVEAALEEMVNQIYLELWKRQE